MHTAGKKGEYYLIYFGTETPTEWAFLEVLVRNSGKLVSRSQLLHEVWGPSYSTETNYLRVYAAQLRAKLESDPLHPELILTVRGAGYKMRESPR